MKKITIITSVYKADELIHNYLKHITNLNGFKLCRLLLYDIIDSHQNPIRIENIIENYKTRYDNIEYIKIDEDPGLYEIWNMGVRESNTEFITNANLDDFRHPNYLVKALYIMDKYIVDLYSTNYYITKQISTEWNCMKQKLKSRYPSINNYYIYRYNDMFQLNKDFTYDKKCYPHCAPIWRKALHMVDNKVSILFNEDKYGACADYEFWIHSCKYHNSKFLLDYEPMILYYEGIYNHGVVGKIKNKELEEEIHKSSIYKYFISKNQYKYHSQNKLINMGVHNYLNIKIMRRYINN